MAKRTVGGKSMTVCRDEFPKSLVRGRDAPRQALLHWAYDNRKI